MQGRGVTISGRNIDYALLSPQSSNSPSVQIHGRDNRGKGIFNEYTIPASFIQQFQNSALTSGATRSLPSSSVSDTQVPYGFRPGDSLYQQSPKSLGDGVKDASIPTRSAGLKIRSSPSSSSNQNPSIDIDNNTIKEELNSMNSPEEDHTVS
ncbi:two-component response regulator ARR2 [Spatholobus suberectus]|nr:two-component response regulator ARR2 [Spatholobus suberectus]